jgi:UPF0271 protein
MPLGASIDLNADVGEGFGPWPMGHDEALMAVASTVNIACGFHAGDPVVISRTIEAAVRAGLAIGAHPGYPDREGFGRRELVMSAAELEASILYQVAAVGGMVAALGGTLAHVKAHGALYNRAAVDAGIAGAIARAVRQYSPHLVLFGPPRSELLAAADTVGLRSVAEGFADRAYEADGSLRSRRLEGALLTDPGLAAAQAVALARAGQVQTLCVHSDTPGAPEIARAVRSALEDAGFAVQPAAANG